MTTKQLDWEFTLAGGLLLLVGLDSLIEKTKRVRRLKKKVPIPLLLQLA